MNLYDRIPNNVNLSEDKKLQRALEKVAAKLSRLVARDGAEGFQEKDVWLRTAISVGSKAGRTSIT
jgi:benzoyl-CoA 2,3-dioxygenase component B